MSTENKQAIERTPGEWAINNCNDENGNIVLKRQEKMGDQPYFTIAVKNSFECIGFFYPKLPMSEEKMIANVKAICDSVNRLPLVIDENEKLKERVAYLESLIKETLTNSGLKF